MHGQWFDLAIFAFSANITHHLYVSECLGVKTTRTADRRRALRRHVNREAGRAVSGGVSAVEHRRLRREFGPVRLLRHARYLHLPGKRPFTPAILGSGNSENDT